MSNIPKAGCICIVINYVRIWLLISDLKTNKPMLCTYGVSGSASLKSSSFTKSLIENAGDKEGFRRPCIRQPNSDFLFLGKELCRRQTFGLLVDSCEEKSLIVTLGIASSSWVGKIMVLVTVLGTDIDLLIDCFRTDAFASGCFSQ